MKPMLSQVEQLFFMNKVVEPSLGVSCVWNDRPASIERNQAKVAE